MIGQRRVDDRKRADEPRADVNRRVGELGDHLIEPLPQPRRAGLRPVQIEDRGPDLLDDRLQVIDGTGEALPDLRRLRARDRALQ